MNYDDDDLDDEDDYGLDNLSEEELSELEELAADFPTSQPTTKKTILPKHGTGNGYAELTDLDLEDLKAADLHQPYVLRDREPNALELHIRELERELKATHAELDELDELDKQFNRRAPEERREPTREELDPWINVDTVGGKVSLKKPIPALVDGERVRHEIPAGANPVTVWKKPRQVRCRDGKVRTNPKKWGLPVLLLPKLRFVQASRVVWLFATGSYPEGPISPLDGSHRNLAFANWRPAAEALALRNEARKELGRRASIAHRKDWMAKHRAEQRARKATARKVAPAQPAPAPQEPAYQGHEATQEPVSGAARGTSVVRKCVMGG